MVDVRNDKDFREELLKRIISIDENQKKLLAVMSKYDEQYLAEVEGHFLIEG